MSTTAFTYTRSISAGFPTTPSALMFKRKVVGVKCTGLDRSKPQTYNLDEGQALSWRYSKRDGTPVGSPLDPTAKSAHEGIYMPFGGGFPSAVNASYSQMVKKLNGEQSAIGVAAAEWRKSFGMIANRSMTLYRAYKALRKGDFRSFLNALRTTPLRRDRGRTRAAVREASSVWLEYSFGWKPSVNDIYSACAQLSEPLPSNEKVFGRSGDSVRKYYAASAAQDIGYRYRIEQGARFALVNPNLYLAAQLGLTNPALIAWELVPFSFLADWCFDVSSFLGAFSDFMGLSVKNSYRSDVTICDYRLHSTDTMSGVYHSRQVFMKRQPGLTRPFPNMDVQANLGGSKQRAANGVALLGQILSE